MDDFLFLLIFLAIGPLLSPFVLVYRRRTPVAPLRAVPDAPTAVLPIQRVPVTAIEGIPLNAIAVKVRQSEFDRLMQGGEWR